jgi:hypothetical protein
LKAFKIRKVLAILTLVIITLGVLLGSAGCTATIPGLNSVQLQETLVPTVDLDVYLYINQQVPTNVPKTLTGASSDIKVQSLSIWGIIKDINQPAVGGALTFSTAADASTVFDQFKNSKDFFIKLSDKNIYFIQGSGSGAESLKTAISNNSFKRYDDKQGLAEAAKLPSGGTAKPGLIGIIKPDQAVVDLVKKFLDRNTANTLESLYSGSKAEIIALGIFSSQPIDFAVTAQRISDNTIWDTDLGIVISVASAYPGIIFSPIAGQYFKNQGLTEIKVGDLTAYKYSAGLGSDKVIPIYLNISGNHVFAVASGKDSYAQTLLTGIKR